MKHVVALILALLMNAAANLMMKAGMTRVQAEGGLLRNGPLGGLAIILVSPILLVGLACFALNAGLYMFALQSPKLQISLAYPLMVGGGFAVIATIAYVFLHERLSGVQWLGVTLILLGVCVVAAGTSRP